MLPFFFVWAGYGAAWYEETVFALGAIAAVVGELMAWRAIRGEVSSEVRSLRDDLAGLRSELAVLRAEVEAHRSAVAASLDLDRRLLRLEAAAPDSDDEG